MNHKIFTWLCWLGFHRLEFITCSKDDKREWKTQFYECQRCHEIHWKPYDRSKDWNTF